MELILQIYLIAITISIIQIKQEIIGFYKGGTIIDAITIIGLSNYALFTAISQ